MTTGRSEFDEFVRVLLLVDYNTRLVVAGTTLLAAAAGLTGSFLLLRKRALMGDALSHATLPGVVMAFMVMTAAGGTGKSLPGLLLGALVSGLLGVAAIAAIRAGTRLRDDAALGIVLSVFFGLGVVLLRVIQDIPGSSAAGLSSFIYGKTASMTRADVLWIGGAALAVGVVCALLSKELVLLCFDEDFGRATGWPTRWLDAALMALITVVTVIGLQAVGLILVIALLVIPPAAARFWTDRMRGVMIGAVVIGVLGGWTGSAVSAVMPRMPAGAVIVLASASLFLFSMLFGTSRGVVQRTWQHWAAVGRVRQQHLLRAMYEALEPDESLDPVAKKDAWTARVPIAKLASARSWTTAGLRRELRRARRRELRARVDRGHVALTRRGRREASRIVRNHRLWEMYLIQYADVAPNHVDRDADQIEHVLGAELVHELERLLGADRAVPMPASPHELGEARA